MVKEYQNLKNQITKTLKENHQLKRELDLLKAKGIAVQLSLIPSEII